MQRLTLALVCSLALCAGHAAAAVAGHRPNSYCGDEYCQYAKKNGEGIRYIMFRSFVHRGKVKVCVRAPDGARSCVNDSFRDRNDDGTFVTRLRWSTNFPNKGAGDYTVRWRQDGERTGKTLGFHKR